MTYWDGKDIPNNEVDEKNIRQLQIIGVITKICYR
jgi:hypothetical protein